MDSQTVKYYYQQIERYDWVTDPSGLSKLFHALRSRHIATLANKYIVPNSVVADMGCGTGLITRGLNGQVTGLDINEWAIERARKHCPTAHFVLADLDCIPLTSSSIDVAVCSDVLEHLLEPNKTVWEIWRVLKRDGYLIGEVPADNFVWRHRKLFGSYPGREPFHNVYNIDQLPRLLHPLKILAVHKPVLGCELSFVAKKEL